MGSKPYFMRSQSTHTIQHQPESGFSLIETLVATAILLVMVTGVMALVHQVTDSSESITNRLSASYLASDAIEYLRADRDTYWLQDDSNDLEGWINNRSLDNCENNSCIIDTRINGGKFSQCSGDCDPLWRNQANNEYGHPSNTSNWEKSRFTRSFEITQNNLADPETEEVIIDVTVSWEHNGTSRSLTVTDSLTDWRVTN